MYIPIYVVFGGESVKIIGLCGGSGSGKSTVCDIFAIHNILPINTDDIYRELTSKKTACLDAIKSEFGEAAITDECALNRKYLAQIVFSDEQKRKRLNEIAHFYVLEEVRGIISSVSEKYFGVIVDAPLLFESGFDRECDVVVAVIADEPRRIGRIMQRDGIDENMALRRIRTQISNEELSKKSKYVIVNNGDVAELYEKVAAIVSDLNK